MDALLFIVLVLAGVGLWQVVTWTLQAWAMCQGGED